MRRGSRVKIEITQRCSQRPNETSIGGKVDSILDDPYNGGKRIGIDAVIVNAMAESHISEQSVLDPLHPLRAAEKIKQGRHKEQCEARGMKYLTLLATTFGAVSGDFWKVVMKPFFSRNSAPLRRGMTLRTFGMSFARSNAFLICSPSSSRELMRISSATYRLVGDTLRLLPLSHPQPARRLSMRSTTTTTIAKRITLRSGRRRRPAMTKLTAE